MELSELIIIDESKILPLNEELRIAAFAIMIDGNMDTPADFFNFLAQTFIADIDFGFIDEDLSDEDSEALRSGIMNSEIVIFLLLSVINLELNLSEKMIKHIQDFSENKQCILITNQKVVHLLPKIDVIITMPDTSTLSLATAIINLSGKTIEN